MNSMTLKDHKIYFKCSKCGYGWEVIKSVCPNCGKGYPVMDLSGLSISELKEYVEEQRRSHKSDPLFGE